MQFVVHSPLPPSECRDRLTRAIEGPIPSFGSRLVGWHVFGRVTDGHVEATIVGVKVGADGRKRPSLRPLLRAELAKGENGTVVTGEVANRYDSRKTRINRFLAPLAIAACALWAIASLSARWPILAFDGVALAMVGFEWFSRKRFSALRDECDSELLAWLERTVEGKQERSSVAVP